MRKNRKDKADINGNFLKTNKHIEICLWHV